MRITFAVAALLIVCAIGIALGTYPRTLRNRALAPDAELQADKKGSG
jgi:hypothetical protein